MAKSQYTPTDRIGVAAVDLAVTSKLNWIFREQVVVDFGVDAQIEVVDENNSPTGRLIAVQIKTGKSYLEEQNDSGIVFRGDNSHLEYWTKHSLPVIVALHDPDTHVTYWEVVNETTITRTPKAWKMTVPKSQTIDDHAAAKLSKLSVGPPEVNRLNKLRLAKPMMQEIQGGGIYYLEAEEWVNKTSGRGSVRIVDEESNESVEWRHILVGLTPYAEVFSGMFPWAEFQPDYELYADVAYDRFLEEHGIWDSEDKIFLVADEDARKEYIEDFCAPGVRPYDYNSGEVASYRLEIKLNEIGKSFLSLDTFLSGEQAIFDALG